MLVFSRRVGERIRIGDDVEVTVVRIRGHEVQLGFSAPLDVAIHRAEVHERIANTLAAGDDALAVAPGKAEPA